MTRSLRKAQMIAHTAAKEQELRVSSWPRSPTTCGGRDEMIRNLLDVSRIRSRQALPLSIGACDLAALVSDVVEKLQLAQDASFTILGPTSLPASGAARTCGGWWRTSSPTRSSTGPPASG